MEKELFEQLKESLEEAADHLGGEEALPEQNVHFSDEPDPREIRARMELTQEEFAELLGVSVRTLQGWEQGRRRPRGPSARLLRVASKRPDALRQVA
jgi:putative transcriptional regulator